MPVTLLPAVTLWTLSLALAGREELQMSWATVYGCFGACLCEQGYAGRSYNFFCDCVSKY
jgi:hypothetical protein